MPHRTLRLSAHLDRAVTQAAAEEGVTVSYVIRRAITDHLGQERIAAARPDPAPANPVTLEHLLAQLGEPVLPPNL